MLVEPIIKLNSMLAKVQDAILSMSGKVLLSDTVPVGFAAGSVACITNQQAFFAHQVRPILQKHGANAHLFLPGVGAINGFAAGNYLESTGQTNASVDGAVGLVLDAAGQETAMATPTTATAVGWSTYLASVASNGTDLTITNTSASEGYAYFQNGNIIAGKTYRLEFEIVARSSAGGSVQIGQTTVPAGASGLFSARVRATNTHGIWIGAGTTIAGNSVTIRNVKLWEVTGAHATQATTANKPILRQINGKFAWQFDGSNDALALPGPLFQQADDHCVVVAANPSVLDSTYRRLFTQENGSPTVCEISGHVTGYAATWRDDAAVVTSIATPVIPVGVPVVLSARKVGNTRTLRSAGSLVGSYTMALGTTTLGPSAYIGNRAAGGRQWNGLVYPIIIIKGTVSDSDLRVLEKWLGSLAGVSIA